MTCFLKLIELKLIEIHRQYDHCSRQLKHPRLAMNGEKKHEMTGNESRVIFPVKGRTYFIPSKKLVTLEDSISENEKERLKFLFLKALIS